MTQDDEVDTAILARLFRRQTDPVRGRIFNEIYRFGDPLGRSNKMQVYDVDSARLGLNSRLSVRQTGDALKEILHGIRE